MFLSMLIGCVPPSVLGLRTDGYLGPAGTIEVSGGYGSSLRALDMQDADGPIDGGGAMVAWSPTDEVKLGLGAGFVSDLVTPTAEVTVRVVGDAEDPLSVAAVGGVEVLVGGEPTQVGQGGLHGGGVISYEVAPDLRPYVGVLGEVDVLEGSAAMFSDVSAGVGWRPALTDQLGLLFLVEATWVHGAGVDAEWTYDALTAEGMVGLSWTPAAK